MSCLSILLLSKDLYLKHVLSYLGAAVIAFESSGWASASTESYHWLFLTSISRRSSHSVICKWRRSRCSIMLNFFANVLYLCFMVELAWFFGKQLTDFILWFVDKNGKWLVGGRRRWKWSSWLLQNSLRGPETSKPLPQVQLPIVLGWLTLCAYLGFGVLASCLVVTSSSSNW